MIFMNVEAVPIDAENAFALILNITILTRWRMDILKPHIPGAELI